MRAVLQEVNEASRASTTLLERHVRGLLGLERQVIAAYDVAAELVEDAALRARLQSFREEHRERLEQVEARCAALLPPCDVGRASAEVSYEGVIQGMSLMTAMWHNEDEVALAYEELLELADAPPELKETFSRGLDAARRHWAWLALQCYGADQASR